MKHLLLYILIELIFTSFAMTQVCTDDGFEVSDNMLTKYYNELNIGDYYSFDRAWFKNKQLNATLVIDLHTDYSKTAYYLFNSNFIDTAIAKNAYLDLKEGEGTFKYISDIKKQVQGFKLFVDSAKEVDKKYFTSKKGVLLGMSKEEVLKKYKSPVKIKESQGVEIYKWNCIYPKCRQNCDTIIENKLPKDFGMHVTLYFKQNRLIAIMILLDNIG